MMLVEGGLMRSLCMCLCSLYQNCSKSVLCQYDFQAKSVFAKGLVLRSTGFHPTLLKCLRLNDFSDFGEIHL